ncbi:hypothetical protein EC836_109220 [Erwinia sp. JUb26]|nr:hypothetical protein EC836_109220 [Erwinia sp. JUb26]
MIKFEDKKQKAIALLEEKKMWRSNYAPPILRLCWKLGGKVPPSPFAPFWLNTLLYTAWFGPLWGVLMWLSSWQNQHFSVLRAVSTALITGLLFGISMALFHYWGRWKNKLPDWKSL